MACTGRVGKTSLVIRYCKDEFNEKEQSTIQASHLTKWLTIGDCNVMLNVWVRRRPSPSRLVHRSLPTPPAAQDTAGQERFHALGPIYYRDADGALLVYDITDVDSFARVKNWVKELRKIVGDDIAICIAGNKMDLQKNAHVSVEEADAYAASVGAQHIRTSAKLNQGVNDVFMALVQSERCPPSTGPACIV